MKFVDGIRSELVKVIHTPFAIIHTILPVAGASLFTLYFLFYKNVAPANKIDFILELTAMAFPLLISIIVGLNISLEEKASHFQTLLAVPCRGKSFLAKLITLYFAGVLSLIALFVLFLLGTLLTGQVGTVPIPFLLQAVFGLAIWNFVIYTLHLFLSLKFGLGSSLFWGVFESLQCILFSNIELQGAARLIPFAWSVDWIHDSMNKTTSNHIGVWGTAVVLTIAFVIVTVRWFIHWEGRKNYE